jgi:hypothetical protein
MSRLIVSTQREMLRFPYDCILVNCTKVEQSWPHVEKTNVELATPLFCSRNNNHLTPCRMALGTDIIAATTTGYNNYNINLRGWNDQPSVDVHRDVRTHTYCVCLWARSLAKPCCTYIWKAMLYVHLVYVGSIEILAQN